LYVYQRVIGIKVGISCGMPIAYGAILLGWIIVGDINGDIKPKIDIGFSINGRSPNCLVYNYPNLKMMVQGGFQSHGGTPLFIA